jgi:hypothetical protein
MNEMVYLEESGTFHSTILGKKYMEYDFIIEIPHRLLVIF